MPAISVITPCYNYARYLGATLDCLLRQSFTDWECVIIDDGSTDASPEVARGYETRDGRFRCLRQENQGLPAARNTALRAARGKYVFCLDADDLIGSAALGWLAAAMGNRSQRVCLMQARNFIEDPSTDGFPFEARPKADRLLPNILADNLAPPHCYLAERTMVLEAGGFDVALRACEDWDLWIRLALLGAELIRVDRIGAFYRRHPTSMSAGKFRMWDAALRVRWKAYRRFTPDDPRLNLTPAVKTSCRRTIATYLKRDWLRLAAKLARHGEDALSERYFALARAPGIPTEARIYPGELWGRYGLYRVTRPCQPPNPKVLDHLRRLCREFEEAFVSGPRRPAFLSQNSSETASTAQSLA